MKRIWIVVQCLLDLGEDDPHDPANDRLLVRQVVIYRHRIDTEFPAQPAHAQ